jgi:hypothetical protein
VVDDNHALHRRARWLPHPETGDGCPGVTCTEGNVCSAADGLCHCGERSGPICWGDLACTIFTDRCVAVCVPPPICESYPCSSPYETCDPRTGECVCGSILDGGPPPPVCSSGFFCSSFDGGAPPQCFQPCDPYTQNCPTLPPPDGGLPDASILQGCYYEQELNALVCEPELNPNGYEGIACNENSDCPVDPQLGGMACFPLTADEVDAGLARACRYYCDTFDGGTHLCPGVAHWPALRHCVPVAIVDAGGVDIAVGACQPY